MTTEPRVFDFSNLPCGGAARLRLTDVAPMGRAGRLVMRLEPLEPFDDARGQFGVSLQELGRDGAESEVKRGSESDNFGFELSVELVERWA
jgi:hypothetical protein